MMHFKQSLSPNSSIYEQKLQEEVTKYNEEVKTSQVLDNRFVVPFVVNSGCDISFNNDGEDTKDNGGGDSKANDDNGGGYKNEYSGTSQVQSVDNILFDNEVSPEENIDRNEITKIEENKVKHEKNDNKEINNIPKRYIKHIKNCLNVSQLENLVEKVYKKFDQNEYKKCSKRLNIIKLLRRKVKKCRKSCVKLTIKTLMNDKNMKIARQLGLGKVLNSVVSMQPRCIDAFLVKKARTIVAVHLKKNFNG